MKWTVGKKIALGYLIAALMMLLMGLSYYWSSRSSVESAAQVKHSFELLLRLEQTLSDMIDIETSTRGFAITGDETFLGPYNNALKDIDEHFNTLNLAGGSYAAQIARLNQLMKERRDIADDVIRLRRGSNGLIAAQQEIGSKRGKNKMDEIRDEISKIEKAEDAKLKAREDANQQSINRTNLTIFVAVLLSILLLVITGYLIAQNITRPIADLAVAAEQIGAGDLGARITVGNRNDEVGVLALAFTRMNSALKDMAIMAEKVAGGDLTVAIRPQSERDVMGLALVTMVENLSRSTRQIREDVNVLASVAGEILAAVSEVVTSTTETATAVNETATTIEEMRQTAQLSNQKARTVSDTAQKTAQVSQSGNRSVSETIQGMNQIREQMNSVAKSIITLSEQSQTIGVIIATVNDLAEQSNILAINAAIEAARAGEHGRGFAVVAQEVKNLADQSKQATAQVRAILSDIQQATTNAVMATERSNKAVEEGVKQSQSAGESIQQLSRSISEAAQAVAQISVSAQEQVIGVDQVSIAVDNIKEASAQNVASMRQVEVSARNINELGQRLKDLTAKYRL